MKKLFSILLITSLVFLSGSVCGMKRKLETDQQANQQTHYSILSVPRNATTAEIIKAYENLAVIYHPDNNKGNEEWANEEFNKILTACEVLKNTYQRRYYDRWLHLGDAVSSDSLTETEDDFSESIPTSSHEIAFNSTLNIKKCYGCPNLISGSTGFSLSPCCLKEKISLCDGCYAKPDISCFLCRKNIEIEIKDGFIHLNTPVTISYENMHKPVRKKVNTKTIDDDFTDVTLPLHKASMQGDFQSVSYLANKDRASINQVDDNGKTALHYASALGKLSIVTLLCHRGADALLQDTSGKTALHYACEKRFPNMITHLLPMYDSTSINTRDSYGKTPLFYLGTHMDTILIREKMIDSGALL